MPFEFDFSELVRLERRLRKIGRNQAQLELERALTDAGRATRTESTRAIRERYHVQLKWLNAPPRAGRGRGRRISNPRFNFNDLSFTITGQGGGVNLIEFLAGSQSRYLQGRPPKKGVPVRVLRGKKTLLGSAFVRIPRTGRNRGRPLVLRRASGAGRYPTRQLYGPSPAQMLGHDDIVSRIHDFAEDRLVQRLDRRLTRLIERAR